MSLAHADLGAFQAAVVVFSAERNQRGLPAVMVEAGIAAGRGLPLLMIVAPDQAIPPAFATIPVVKTELTNREALCLHLEVFAKSLGASVRQFVPPPTSRRLSPQVAAQFDVQLALLLSASPARSDRAIERFVVELLSAAGANLEVEPVEHDRGLRAAAFIPGEEERLGLLLVEVKDRLGSASRIIAERRLQSDVIEARAGLGLLLYVSPASEPSTPSTPLVLSMPIGQLVSELRVRPLSRILVQARNEAVHRL